MRQVHASSVFCHFCHRMRMVQGPQDFRTEVLRISGASEKARSAIEKAMEWVVANKNPEGWPDFPGMETNLERTCDGLDVLLKYQAWRQADSKEVIRRWGYLPGEPTFLRGVTAGV